jgi:16S rRNA (guanine966-N2)-methyltransferase
VRIIAGRFRGKTLQSPADLDIRPTSDRVREAIFNLLINAHGDPVSGARVLDLFAGTGALGLEALSRGASEVTFVDDGGKALALIRANVAKMRAERETRVLRQDARKLGPNAGAAYGLVFLDPPYGKALGEAALSAARKGGWLAPGAMVVWEEGVIVTAPEGFVQVDQRKYGDALVTLLRAPE